MVKAEVNSAKNSRSSPETLRRTVLFEQAVAAERLVLQAGGDREQVGTASPRLANAPGYRPQHTKALPAGLPVHVPLIPTYSNSIF